MAGRIPKAFIDQVLSRVDIVDVIERRVPLTRAGGEYKACCPFHEEKTPSFTVSPAKQFYHCFGCGAHGSAIGFLMDYAHLSFVEAVEELAEGVGLQVPSETTPQAAQPADSSLPSLLQIVEQANHWFQQQLRTHAEGKRAVAYLKERGLDGRTAADFGIGYAPKGWDNLARALGTDAKRRRQLQKAGLVAENDQAKLYDRFRGRVIFPIEDHRGRVVAFGGRILGAGEPKYLNSPETPLFHKGAELYRLDSARQAIGKSEFSIVVEGYMDVVGLAQFGIDNAVATLGTATTRTHLQRLFRLAPRIVFCFDGDRAGRAAAWKALQTALPEMRDDRQAGFLFLPEGEDPDSVVRAEGRDGFAERVDQALALEDFLLEHLIEQVDMATPAGLARLVDLADPMIAQLPAGARQELLYKRLTETTGLSSHQLKSHSAHSAGRAARRRPAQPDSPMQGQLSPLALAISLLLQHPQLAASIPQPDALKKLNLRGAPILLELIEQIIRQPDITTARLLESFRQEPTHDYLEKLATRAHYIDEAVLAEHFNDALARLLDHQDEQRRLALFEKIRQGVPEGAEKQRLQQEMKALLDARNEKLKARAHE